MLPTPATLFDAFRPAVVAILGHCSGPKFLSSMVLDPFAMVPPPPATLTAFTTARATHGRHHQYNYQIYGVGLGEVAVRPLTNNVEEFHFYRARDLALFLQQVAVDAVLFL